MNNSGRVRQAMYAPPQIPKSPQHLDDEDEDAELLDNDGYELEACESSCCDKDCECDDCTRCADNSLNPYDEEHPNLTASAA